MPGWPQLIRCVPQVWVVVELGVGCSGAGCGSSSWSWVWVIMELGVGHHGARCGSPWSRVWLMELGVGRSGAGCGKCSKQSAVHKAPKLSAVVGCPRPLQTLSIFLGSWVWVVMVLGVGHHGAGCGSSWSWVWKVLKEVCRTQSPPTLCSSRMTTSS